MRRSILLSIMVLGAVILAGSLALHAQQDPYEPVSAESTPPESSTIPEQEIYAGETTPPAQASETDSATQSPSSETAGTATEPSQPVNQQTAAQMPRTASPLPLIALFGVLAICLSLSLRVMSRFRNGEAHASRR